MPFTPYHFGPNGLAGMILVRWVNLPAFILVNVAIDLEPLVVILNNIRKYPEHGFFHSFAGATVAALLFSLFYSSIKKPVNNLMGLIGLRQNVTLLSIVLGCILGGWTHVFMDSFLYRDIMPFFPSYFNPMYGKVSPPEMRLFCVLAGIAGAGVFIVRAVMKRLGDR